MELKCDNVLPMTFCMHNSMQTKTITSTKKKALDLYMEVILKQVSKYIAYYYIPVIAS